MDLKKAFLLAIKRHSYNILPELLKSLTIHNQMAVTQTQVLDIHAAATNFILQVATTIVLVGRIIGKSSNLD